MPEIRFDLSYSGHLAPGGDPALARQHLAAVFRLSEKGAERLFTGVPVVVQRNVDAQTAARYEKIFSQAGAILTITALPSEQDPESGSILSPPSVTRSPDITTTSHLTLGSQTDDLEERSPVSGPQPDTSHLSLVSGDHWTLEDCQVPQTPHSLPDISYLSLEPVAPRLTAEPDLRS